MEPQSNEEVLTLRVGKDLKAAFLEMAEKNRSTRANMFETLIKKYKNSKQAKKFIDLQKAHERLSTTCEDLQQQLFDVFTTYSDALDDIQAETDDMEKLRAENQKLVDMIIEQQHTISSKNQELKELQDILDYMTAELERVQNGEKA
jgi:vacuolar-type H+-ATPase subunit I/STV1